MVLMSKGISTATWIDNSPLQGNKEIKGTSKILRVYGLGDMMEKVRVQFWMC